MKPIILASASPQRKKLLQQLNVPFTIIPSHTDELTKITTTPAALVKANAQIKAEHVASLHPDRIVIGADTIVYVGNKKMIGKPKDLHEAKRNLKLLMSRPSWVYTGVTILHKKDNIKITDYEKTRVFMLHLTDEEIDRYYKKMSPLDKAGGFDIEGGGSAFIHRIEGCYTNVIGLPMAKLARMLKKVGVPIMGLFFLIALSGCVSEFNLATKKQERLLYNTEKEVQIGDSFARRIESHYEIVTDVEENERVKKILERIVAVSDRQDVVYFIKILDEDIVNAVSLPGGYVYVFKGLMDKLKSDDELAGVIAHEVGHITAKHGIKRLQNAYGYLLLQVAAIETGGGNFAAGVNYALTSLFMEYSQQDEFQADRLGIKYMQLAGFDPKGMMLVLEVLEREAERSPIREFSYWRTHPHISQRMAVVNQEITGELKYRDYLKLIGEE